MTNGCFKKVSFSKIFRKTRKELRITALMMIRNEEIYLEKSLGHLIKSGLSVVIIDNHSSDNSVELIKSFIERGMPVKLYHHPFSGTYDWEALLKKTEEIAHQIDTDWFIFTSPDEIMEPPLPFHDLSEGIKSVDKQGYNAINFDEFVFIPSGYDESYVNRDYEKEMRYYYFHEPHPLRLLRAWKPNGKRFDMVRSGSHNVIFDHQKIYPQNFILKHYIFLSYEYGVQKYSSRIFTKEDIDKGWHFNRYYLSSATIKLPSRHEMKEVTDKQRFDTSDPKKKHLFITGSDDPSNDESPLNLRIIHKIPSPAPSLWNKKQQVCFLLTYDLNSIRPLMPFLSSITRNHIIIDPEGLRNYVRAILKQLEVNNENLAEKPQVPVAYCQDMVENVPLNCVLDITPENNSIIPAIQRLIPVSKFIHIIQDIKTMDVKPLETSDEIRRFGLRWAEYLKETRQNSQYCQDYMEIKIEDLKHDPSKFYQKMLSFLGMEWDEKLALSIPEQDCKKETSNEIEYPDGIKYIVDYWRIELGYV